MGVLEGARVGGVVVAGGVSVEVAVAIGGGNGEDWRAALVQAARIAEEVNAIVAMQARATCNSNS